MKEYSDKLTHLIDSIKQYKMSEVFVIESIGGQAYTYADVYEKANRLGLHLLKSRKSEFIICSRNSFELFIFYFAAMFFNLTIIPVDPDKSTEEIEKIRGIHSSAVFYSDDDVNKIMKNLPEVTVDTIGIENVDLMKTYLITYTSGSTGEPKGVKHSVANLFLSALEFGTLMQYDTHTIMCHVMPMTYMAGILNTIFLPYIVGGKIVLMPRFSMRSAFQFWNEIAKYQVNTLWLSPMMLRVLDMLDRKGAMREYLHNANAKISVGTAPLDNALRLRIEEKYGLRIYQSYGLSETLFISTETPDTITSNNSVGKILSGANIKFMEDNELLISVPWMFQGYLNDSRDKQYTYYHSGDIGEIINEELYIRGRKKDIIIRGGFNINPRDIENVLTERLIVDECSVFSLNINGEENIICCYTGAKNRTINEMNVIIQEMLGKKYCLDILEKMQSIPKNLNGKTDKNKLKDEMEKKYDFKS